MLIHQKAFQWCPQNPGLNICIQTCRFQSAGFPRKLSRRRWLLRYIVGYNLSWPHYNLSDWKQWSHHRCLKKVCYDCENMILTSLSRKTNDFHIFEQEKTWFSNLRRRILCFQRPVQHKAHTSTPRLSFSPSICFGTSGRTRKDLRQLQPPTQHSLAQSILADRQGRCRLPESSQHCFPWCNLCLEKSLILQKNLIMSFQYFVVFDTMCSWFSKVHNRCCTRC